MKVSNIGLKNNKITSIDEQFPIQSILEQTGQINQFASGIYGYGHIPFLVLQNIKKVISEKLTNHGCSILALPLLQPESLWIASGRLDRYVKDKVMFRCLTDKGNYCLAPTAEEAVVDYAKTRLLSYKDLPVTYFQIGEKFRDEIRCRGYLLRGKSFEMLDAYSFGRNVDDLEKEYANIKEAYFEIFDELGLKVQAVSAYSGAIGGDMSEEFMFVSDIGEDNVLIDDKGQAFNSELLENKEALARLNIKNINDLKTVKAVELGHIFALKDKYSKSMKATYVGSSGENEYYQMGCYGIGVSRTLAMIYENGAITDENGKKSSFVLPINLSPYLAYIVTKNDDPEKFNEAIKFYNNLEQKSIPVLLDDREASIGFKIKTNNIVGCPYMIVFGSMGDGKVEVENNKTKEKMYVDETKLLEALKVLNENKHTALEEILKQI